MGYPDLWALAGILGRTNNATASQQEKVAHDELNLLSQPSTKFGTASVTAIR